MKVCKSLFFLTVMFFLSFTECCSQSIVTRAVVKLQGDLSPILLMQLAILGAYIDDLNYIHT